MDFWGFLFVLSLAVLGVVSVKNIVRFIRKFNKGKKVGIIKVVAGLSTIIMEALGVGLIIFAANRLSAAHGYRVKAGEYQQILDKVQNLSSSLPESRAKVEKAIEDLTESASLLNIVGWYLLMLGISEITSGIASIILITEEGIVWSNLKVPEPFTATYQNGKINVTIKADLANEKKVWTFMGTPENLAKFGRFIEWDETENEAVPAPETAPEPETESEEQPAPPPDSSNMQT